MGCGTSFVFAHHGGVLNPWGRTAVWALAVAFSCHYHPHPLRLPSVVCYFLYGSYFESVAWTFALLAHHSCPMDIQLARCPTSPAFLLRGRRCQHDV